jgi:hypothetical protein
MHVALIEPRIPPNTGNIARLCAATDSALHLIEPLGFRIDDADVRRAGLDYWDAVDLWVHPGWRAFREAMSRPRCLYFSANATRPFWEAPFRSNSCLLFGNDAPVQRLHLSGVRVDARHMEPRFGKDHCQRQSHVAKAQYPDPYIFFFQFFDESFLGGHTVPFPRTSPSPRG